MRSLLLVMLSVCLVYGVMAQESVRVDSSKARQPDSLRLAPGKSRFLASIGNLGTPADTTSPLQTAQFLYSDAKNAGDLLGKVPGVFLEDLGQPGLPLQMSFEGIDQRGISLSMDGRPMNDPITGGYDLNNVPIEYVNEVEVIQGAQALLGGENSAGATINFVTHQYNSSRPMTKLRFLQGPYGHILSDGIYAQNVARDLHAMFGFQRQVTDGRYPNSAYDSWNVRARLRYDFTDWLNVWVSDFYTKATAGLNGGVDPLQSPSIYDEVTAAVFDRGTSQTLARHDWTAGLVATPLADSTSRTKFLFYSSSITREFATGGDQNLPPTFTSIQNSAFRGIRMDQRLALPDAAIDLGLQHEQKKIDQSYFLNALTESYTAATAGLNVHPADWIDAEATTRWDRLRNNNSLSMGGRLTVDLSEGFSIRGDVSKSYRVPTIQELYWTDSTIIRGNSLTKEAHTQMHLALHVKAGSTRFSLTFFKRKIENSIGIVEIGDLGQSRSILITNFPSADIIGTTVDIHLPIWKFALDGNLTYTDDKVSESPSELYPRFSSLSEVSYRDQFFGNDLDLKTAFRIRALTHHSGLRYVPQIEQFSEHYSITQLAIYPGQPLAPRMPGFATIDFYVAARLGDAVVNFVWENPFNVTTLVIPYYPLMDRNIKLGVNWTFTD